MILVGNGMGYVIYIHIRLTLSQFCLFCVLGLGLFELRCSSSFKLSAEFYLHLTNEYIFLY